MRITGIHQNVLLRFLLIPAIILAFPTLVNARVAGPCANCHTMHNSQDGATEVIVDPTSATNVGWTAEGNLTGTGPGVDTSAQQYLLKTDCVGCHSSPSASRIIQMGGTTSGFKVPIVWNIGDTAVGAAAVNAVDDLAGGNFSYVEPAAQEGYGHNVLGISAPDSVSPAPGTSSGKGCAGSCHESLAITVTGIPESGASENGCQGCHLWTGHHDPMVPGATGPGNAYRFLGGHGGTDGFEMMVSNKDGVLEGADWGTTEVNIYWGQSDTEYESPTELPIGRFCAGCHHKFHAPGGVDEMLGEDNKGSRRENTTTDTIPWLRHPTNVYVKSFDTEDDFAGLIGQTYGAGLPLARTLWQNRSNIGATDQVMCLSCHKAHGSQWPDALRWDYNATIAHSGTGDTTTGCFYCHRTKDL
ncbi:MAG: cytochrome c3 family protein [Desulfurivibrionaceae bacterium]